MLYNPPVINTNAKMIYANNGIAMVGQNSSARMSMLPTPIGAMTGLVKANQMTVGSVLRLDGYGLIRARTTMPGTFVFTPTVTVAGVKTDLPGLTVTPLLGVPGVCELSLFYLQTATGIQTGGIVKYGAHNGMPYSLMINEPSVGSPAAIVASDPSVDRIFGADGQWMIADVNNYIIPTYCTMTLFS